MPVAAIPVARRTLVVLFALVTSCKPSPEAARKALASPDAAERQKAATMLQAMYAKQPSSLGDHGESYWTARLAEARGKTTSEAVSILGGAKLSGGEAGGGGESVGARLDDFWVATLGRSTRGDDIVFETGTPRRNVIHVGVSPPAGFTGTWTTYYVHGGVYEATEVRSGALQRAKEFHEGGQLRTEMSYVDGKADGTAVTRSPGGTLEREQIWSKGQLLAERTYFPTGKVEYETTYRGGNVERQRSYLESGTVRSCQIFDNGRAKPCED